ncbi:MAG: mannitol dehydrogenase family protein [Clostridiales bacterium]|jgi:fructuronate reductase|nr:mannitol dehydrogenase family protein [Clostridiales bacterium]
MPALNLESLAGDGWAGARLPRYDVAAARARTIASPRWIHFGAGNIFRGYVAALADDLLEAGYADAGIIAAESFDPEIIEKIYDPHDCLALVVTLRANGSASRRVVASVARGLTAAGADYDALAGYFRDPALQMVSFTITEKGYAPRPGSLPFTLAALLRERREACGAPLALVSMDNCSKNGDILKAGVLEAAGADEALAGWIRANVSFPWTMIDKITPRPDSRVRDALAADGFTGIDPVTTGKGTFIAPFVNAEAAQYLVIEDDFPNGRPPLDAAGVILADRDTVGKAERMKVTACLNPLHTALAVYGCLLGYGSIWSEMESPELSALVRRIGYGEGLPVVTRPGIIEPKAFLDEVIGERLPNPYIPDVPARIATDTSQKVGIRFGETIKAHAANGRQSELIGIPLAIAGWLRYLREPLENLSPDPRLNELRAKRPEEILRDATLFGSDLMELGMGGRILGYLARIEDKTKILQVLREELGL